MRSVVIGGQVDVNIGVVQKPTLDGNSANPKESFRTNDGRNVTYWPLVICYGPPNSVYFSR